MHYVRKGFAHSTLLLALISVGCKLQVESGDDDKRVDETEDGGKAATTTSTGGKAATTSGGSKQDTDDQASAGDGTKAGGSSTGGSGGSSAVATSNLIEDCDTDVSGSNDDREHAVELGSGATLCLASRDHDFLYIDAPNDKRAHIARILIEPEPGATAEFTAIADADGSTIGSNYTSSGTDAKLALVLAPGSRTYLDFRPWVGGGIVKLTSTLEAELDTYEPNNEREDASDISVNTEVVAQFHSAYSSDTDHSAVDWYQATLKAGPHTLHIAHVPDDIQLEVKARDPQGGNVGSKYAGSRGQIFDYAFTAATDGVYQFEVGFFVGTPPAFASGNPPKSFEDTYTFELVE